MSYLLITNKIKNGGKHFYFLTLNLTPQGVGLKIYDVIGKNITCGERSRTTEKRGNS